MLCVSSILPEALFFLRRITNAAVPPHTKITIIMIAAKFIPLFSSCSVGADDAVKTVEIVLDSDTVY